MAARLADPQFWIVTAAAVAALAWVVARVVRSARGSASEGCAKCPQSPAAERKRVGRDLLGVALLLVVPASLGAEPLARLVATMGTTLALEVEVADGGRAERLELSERLVAGIEATERELSTWRDDSEIARFNRAPVGADVEFSAGAWRDLETALACAEESGGTFDPTVAPLVEAWGLRSGGRVPSEAEIAAARAEIGAGDRLLALPARRALRKLAPVRLEEGGFGKGAALDRALEIARRAGGRVLLDLGGQLAWTGRRDPLVVRLADPRDRAREVVELRLDGAEGSLATSGNSERSRAAGGRAIGHLLDPRSGRPAADFGSVAYLGGGAELADCRSTALFVAGPERGLAWLGEPGRGEAVYLVIAGERLVARASRGLAGRLRPLVPDLDFAIEGDSS